VFDIGSSLRDARMRQGLDFAELEERTKIRPKYLRALEDERFDVLPAPTYVRGFLRSYARALGLDAEPFVDEYTSRFDVDEDAPLRARRVPQPARRPRGAGRESRIALVALLAIAVVTALVIAAWRFGGASGEPVPGLAQQPAAAPTTAHAPTRLVVRATRGSSWMEVRRRSSAGELEYSGTLERGRSKTFSGTRFQLALAKPGNVTVRVNGRRIDLPQGTVFVVSSRSIARAAS
jgi:transcriptional regulator with XRE-family HTH domain